jgi:cytochrome c
MRVGLAIAALTGLFIGTPTLADEALAKKHNCLACHQMDKKTVGPAYKEVARSTRARTSRPSSSRR